MNTPAYPQTPAEWRAAINAALDLTDKDARAALQGSAFPYPQLEPWIRETYSADRGFAPEFVPALLRNQRGLIAWAYLHAPEPRWPDSDAENPHLA